MAHARAPAPAALPWRGPLDETVGAGPGPVERLFWILFLFAAMGGFSYFSALAEKLIWLAADLAAVIIIARNPNRYIDLASRSWVYILLPGIAIASAVWSHAPFISAYHGAQLAATLLVGLVMVARLGIDGLMRAIFIATGVAVVLSVAAVGAGLPSAVGIDAAWIGIFTHKNVFAGCLTMFVFTAASLSLGPTRTLTFAAAAVVGAMLLPFTRSATSWAAAIGIMTAFMVLVAYRRGPGAIGLLMALAAVLGAAGLMYLLTEDVGLFELFLDVTGKDATLTGRTILWQFAWAAIEEHPILGFGYKGYWESYASTKLYLQYVVRQELWYFHNNFLEVAVAFGVVGLTLFLVVMVATIWRIFAGVMTYPDHAAVWCTCFLLQILIVTLSENPLFSNHSLPQALLLSAYVGVALRVRAAVAAPARRVRPVGHGIGAPRHA
jgi:O-antigen ligase